MQISQIPATAQNAASHLLLKPLNQQEHTLLSKIVHNIQDLRTIHEQKFGKEWCYVLLKISLAMNQYFAECPDTALQARYTCFMEIFSDFVDFADDIDAEVLWQLSKKV
jgi:hypothetical protein